MLFAPSFLPLRVLLGIPCHNGGFGDMKADCFSWKDPIQTAFSLRKFLATWFISCWWQYMMEQWPEAVLYISLGLKTMPKGQGKHCIKNPASILEKEVIQFLLLSTLNNLLYFIQRFPYLFFFLYTLHCHLLHGSLGICPCELLQSSFLDTKEYGMFTLSSIPLCWSLMFLRLTLSLALLFFFSFTYVLCCA